MSNISTQIKPGEVRNPFGRPVGSISKAKRVLNAYEACERLRFNPFDELISIAQNPENGMKHRVEACKAILPYVAQKLNTVKHVFAADDERVSVTLNLSASTTNLDNSGKRMAPEIDKNK